MESDLAIKHFPARSAPPAPSRPFPSPLIASHTAIDPAHSRFFDRGVGTGGELTSV